MKVREVIKRLESEGWDMLKGGRTSHRQFVHPEKPGRVTVPGQMNEQIPKGTLSNIKKQAGW